jgi:excisionase family DNA binding protein
MTTTVTPRSDRSSGLTTAATTASAEDSREAPGDSDPTAYRPQIDHGPAALASDRLVLSVAEAGELLGLSRAFAYELVARGELPVVRFGRRIVVPKAALLELLGSASLDG